MQWPLYAVGAFGYSLLYTALLLMHLYRYDPGEPNPYGLPVLASSALVGIAALIGRIFNPVASLVVGYLSDQNRSPWGRRRPFMALAILPMLAGFVLVFTPPWPYRHIGNAIYLTITLTLFWLSYSAYMAPYLALLAEITHTAQQRIRLSTLVALSNLLGFGGAAIAAPILVAKLGFLPMVLIVGAVGFTCLIAPLAIKENYHLPAPERLPFWESLKTVSQNQIFRPYIVSQVFMWMTVSIIFVCTNYLVVALLGQDISFGSQLNSALIGGIFIGFIPANSLVKRFGKKSLLQYALIALGWTLLVLSIYFVQARDTLWLCLVVIAICGLAMSVLMLLPNAILADIIDEDAAKTGVQRSAIYFGIQAMVMTVSSGFASMFAGLALLLGKTESHPLGVQLVYALAGFFALVSAHLLSAYTIKH
ncbi:MFS transporter [Nostoc sp. UHCC 0702]|nr:MFS transporter [Nostoc sp. UHCC 0702]